MPSTKISRALSTVGEHYSAHPEDAKSEDKPAKASLDSGLRINVEGPGSWSITTDMPTALGGDGSAPSPGWLRRAAQAACEATMIAIGAAREGISLDRLEVTVGSVSDDRGMLGLSDEAHAGPTESWAQVRISAQGVPDERLRHVVEWAEAHSPVTDSLQRAVPHTLKVEIL
jgi:uncharacterized OsmC-like protein